MTISRPEVIKRVSWIKCQLGVDSQLRKRCISILKYMIFLLSINGLNVFHILNKESHKPLCYSTSINCYGSLVNFFITMHNQGEYFIVFFVVIFFFVLQFLFFMSSSECSSLCPAGYIFQSHITRRAVCTRRLGKCSRCLLIRSFQALKSFGRPEQLLSSSRPDAVLDDEVSGESAVSGDRWMAWRRAPGDVPPTGLFVFQKNRIQRQQASVPQSFSQQAGWQQSLKFLFFLLTSPVLQRSPTWGMQRRPPPSLLSVCDLLLFFFGNAISSDGLWHDDWIFLGTSSNPSIGNRKGTFLPEPCLIPWGPNAAVLARCGGLERATSASCVRLRPSDGSRGGLGPELGHSSQLTDDSPFVKSLAFQPVELVQGIYDPPRIVQCNVSLVCQRVTTNMLILLRQATPVLVVKVKNGRHMTQKGPKTFFYCKQAQGAAWRLSLHGWRIQFEWLLSISKDG